LVIACAGLAIAPDLDFFYPHSHRMWSHSLSVTVAVATIAWLAARRAASTRVLRLTVLCGLAYGSHLLLDWLGQDSNLPAGIRLLWPFSDHWFISSWSLFYGTRLRGFFTAPVIVENGITVLREVLLLGPLALAGWFMTRRSRVSDRSATHH
jgi:membrane-bound metal-dependent hydrolase YbcI (DUF457 family)